MHLTAKNSRPHNLGMDYPGTLRAIMRAGDLNQAELAKKLRVTQPTISRWLKRGSRPDLEQHQRIHAEAVRIGLEAPPRPASGESEADQPQVARVVGYVGAGAEAHFYAVAQGELDEVPAPEGATPETVAVEIRGNSLGELFDRWLVFYDQVRSPVTSDLIGRLCVVGLPDDRVLVKKLRRARDGLFDLHSNTEEPIRGVTVEWAARVKSMVPQ